MASEGTVQSVSRRLQAGEGQPVRHWCGWEFPVCLINCLNFLLHWVQTICKTVVVMLVINRNDVRSLGTVLCCRLYTELCGAGVGNHFSSTHVLSASALFVMLAVDSRALPMLSKHSTTDKHPSRLGCYSKASVEDCRASWESNDLLVPVNFHFLLFGFLFHPLMSLLPSGRESSSQKQLSSVCSFTSFKANSTASPKRQR